MSFPADIKKRIEREFGPGHVREDDYSFLEPGGNDHLVQFLFKCFPDEYWDLDEVTRHNLLLADIAGVAGELQFELDDDGSFAVFRTKAGKGRKSIQAVMDLRDELLVVVYYFGEIRICSRLNQQLLQVPTLHACFIDSDMLLRMIEIFEKVIGIEYWFEQSPALFLQPETVRGELRGELVHQLVPQYIEEYANYMNLCSLSGFLTDGSQGSIALYADGRVQTDSCRLSSFLEVVAYVLDILLKKYQILTRRFIVGWNEHPESRIMELAGNPIEIELPFPVEKIDGLVGYLTRGGKNAPFIGSSERISRKLWSIKATDVTSAEQIEFEVSERLIRVYLRNPRAIPLYDQFEQFLRRQVCARLEKWGI